MGTVSVTLPSDGDTIDASDYNTPITTIVNEINGNLSNTNIASGAAISTTKLATDAGIATGMIADDAITAAKIDWAATGAAAGIWWEELGRATLSGAADSITVSGLAARTFLKVILYSTATGGTTRFFLRFNNDTGSNYAYRNSLNGGADSAANGVTGIILNSTAASDQQVAQIEIINVSAIEKMLTHSVFSGATGAASPGRYHGVGKWTNTASQITQIAAINDTGTGDFATGTTMVVLGHN